MVRMTAGITRIRVMAISITTAARLEFPFVCVRTRRNVGYVSVTRMIERRMAVRNGLMIRTAPHRTASASMPKKMIPARCHSRRGLAGGGGAVGGAIVMFGTLYHPRALNVTKTPLPGVLLLEPRVFSDERGFFLETYNAARFRELGIGD